MWFYDFSGKTNPPKRLRASQRRVEWKAVTEPRPKEAVFVFRALWANEPTERLRALQGRVERKAVTEPRP